MSQHSGTRRVTRYLGVADWWGRHVWVERNGVRSSLLYCGQDGMVTYAWGRPGIGSRELARALLFDATGSAALAERFCRDLTHEVVARLPEPEFALERDDVLAWIEDRH
jgi:Family of unknown function (DUF6166)